MIVAKKSFVRKKVAGETERRPELFAHQSNTPTPHCSLFGLTMLEIMIVVGIMGLLVLMSVPIVVKAWKRAPMASALTDFQEVCGAARRDAIMRGKEVDLIIYPQEGRFAVNGGKTSANHNSIIGRVSPAGGTSEDAASSGQFPPQVHIQLLDINKLPHEFRNDESCKVRFFPNGSCDELTIVLLSDDGEQREIMLEVTTSLAIIETDPSKFR